MKKQERWAEIRKNVAFIARKSFEEIIYRNISLFVNNDQRKEIKGE